MTSIKKHLTSLMIFCLIGCQFHGNPDPLESINRPIFRFNQQFDTLVLRPIAQGYVDVVPELPRMMIHNMTIHVRDIGNIPVQTLGLRLNALGHSITRIIINSFLGLGGLFDIAAEYDIKSEDVLLSEISEQYGIKPIFLVVPFLGPTTTIDFAGNITKGYLINTYVITDKSAQITTIGLGVLDKRASLLSFDAILDKKPDPYAYVRTMIMQNHSDLEPPSF